MGIGDWFKRFRPNAEAFEQYREGAGQHTGVAQSQAAFASGGRAWFALRSGAALVVDL